MNKARVLPLFDPENALERHTEAPTGISGAIPGGSDCPRCGFHAMIDLDHCPACARTSTQREKAEALVRVQAEKDLEKTARLVELRAIAQAVDGLGMEE